MAKVRETNLWSVWAGEKEKTTEQYDLESATTSVLWHEMPDLRAFPTKKALRATLDQVYPGHKGNSSALGSLWAFTQRIKVGDYVVMPMRYKKSSMFSIGVVKCVYQYDKSRKLDAFHYRRVRWRYKYMSRSILDADLRRRIAGKATVTPIYVERAAERILAACAAYIASLQETREPNK